MNPKFCLKGKMLAIVVPILPQIILAFGNYMNSSKRGGVYGFKVASLDLVSCIVVMATWVGYSL